MTSMTKMHFEALAEALAEVKPASRGADDRRWALRRDGWAQAVEAVAGACRQFNGAFDHQRFYEACGYFPLARGYGRERDR